MRMDLLVEMEQESVQAVFHQSPQEQTEEPICSFFGYA